eukprot:CAMPEP_0173469504 /NCGR_PEP_ID=MMETSP1357-20121228/77395_1 /TAXON_ID=77926 /ORGANISM="Hemiselmis rufescens, Strain PCC563" /LENGTH=197 /DNA_ID=CAMNT_0014437749 /DNA_START=347 /DNA_END=940 /DNA_ORIENTATION=-
MSWVASRPPPSISPSLGARWRPAGFAARLNLRRILSSSVVGCCLAGFLTIVWFHHIDILIPKSACGLSSPAAAAMLFAKAAAHSFFYGTISNTVGIIGRRMLGGDSALDAYASWRGKIVEVTKRQQMFWMTWQLLAFGVMKPEHAVPMNAFGGFLWNTFMSWVASRPPPSISPSPDAYLAPSPPSPAFAAEAAPTAT